MWNYDWRCTENSSCWFLASSVTHVICPRRARLWDNDWGYAHNSFWTLFTCTVTHIHCAGWAHSWNDCWCRCVNSTRRSQACTIGLLGCTRWARLVHNDWRALNDARWSVNCALAYNSLLNTWTICRYGYDWTCYETTI